MAHWFHRNPIKATEAVNYDLGKVLKASEPSKIATDLRLCRKRLLELFLDSNNELEDVDREFNTYTTLMNGFLFAFDANAGDSKMRHLILYKWTDSMLTLTPIELSDSWFDFLSMLFTMAVWLTKHAARVAARDVVTEAQAKEVHKSLRRAGGIFDYVQQEKGRINSDLEAGADLTSTVIDAYSGQCAAEAQEVTVARAVEMKHSPSLISALSMETARLFDKAAQSLIAESALVFEKWLSYLRLKNALYKAYAYAYHGEALLGEDKCGDAVRCCQEGLKYHAMATELCTTYGKAKGPGATIKPGTHPFFQRIQPILQRQLEKAERENGFIYHQKVPDIVPELGTKDVFGLAKPEQFIYPQADGPWSQQTYQQFDITKASNPAFKILSSLFSSSTSTPPPAQVAKRSAKALPQPNEMPIYQSEKRQNNESGCVIS